MVPQIRRGRVKQDPALIRIALRRLNAFGLTHAAVAPGPAATSAASAAPATSPAAAAAAAAAAPASAPAAPGDFFANLRGCSIFLVEDVERRQAHVGDFLVADKDFVIWGGVLRRDIRRGSTGGC
jgi:hypothetical protein